MTTLQFIGLLLISVGIIVFYVGLDAPILPPVDQGRLQ